MFSNITTAIRCDNDGVSYRLTADQVAEFDRVDEATANDDDFWEWFRSFVQAHDIKPVSKRGVVKASDWFDDTSWQPKNYSDYWGASKWFGSAGTDIERKLAVALQAVRTTVKVIDSGAKRMTVRLAAEGDSLASYTNFDERVIQVSPAALLDPTVDQIRGIDITTGWALHEASHSAYTEPIIRAITHPTELKPVAVSSMLLNVLEDVRIERLTSDRFPGFARYFDIGADYMWHRQLPHIPTAWGPSLNDKINAIILSVKWHDQFLPLAAADRELEVECDWWYDWSLRYIAGEPARALIEEGLARLASDSNTQSELNKQSEDEDDLRKYSATLSDMIRDAINKLRAGQPGIESCPSPSTSVSTGGRAPVNDSTGAPVSLTSDQAESVERLVDAEYSDCDMSGFRFPVGDAAPTSIATMRPVEDDTSRRLAESAKPDHGLLARMRAAFFFRPSAMEWSTRNLRSGTVDDDELWRAGSGDTKFFEQRVIESAPDTNVTLLVDASGSMSGRKMRAAMQAAYTMCDVLRHTRGVRVRVRAHTASVRDAGWNGAIIYRIWDSGDPISRIGTLDTVDHGNNFDGYAIGWCVDELMSESHPNEQNVLFVLSDGLPNGDGANGQHYGDEPAMDHVRSVVEYARRQGVDIIQIAIDSSVRSTEQARMFRNWLPFTDISALPMQITNLLKKIM